MLYNYFMKSYEFNDPYTPANDSLHEPSIETTLNIPPSVRAAAKALVKGSTRLELPPEEQSPPLKLQNHTLTLPIYSFDGPRDPRFREVIREARELAAEYPLFEALQEEYTLTQPATEPESNSSNAMSEISATNLTFSANDDPRRDATPWKKRPEA